MLCLLIIAHDDSFVPSESLVAEIHTWNAEMERRGLRRGGQPLRPPADAVTVRVRGGEPETSPGPFAATAEQLAAFELLECADLDEAVGLASSHPMAAAGTIEVRPVWDELADRGALGKVVWSATMSLDGFIAGPGDAMGWVFDHSGPNPVVDQVMRDTGAVLAGRRSYDVGRRAERPELKEAFGGGWSGAQFVLTHRPHDPDPANTFLSGDIRDAVALALAAAGGKDLNIIGADVARQCLEAGLIDEIVVFVAPVLLGDGVRLFGRPGQSPYELEPLEVSRAGQVANLRFRMRK